jgi:hypothetical protein
MTRFAALLVCVAPFLLGCAIYDDYRETPLERHWGEAQAENRQRMIANPEAEQNLEPVTGLDPVTGQIVLDNYHRDQRKPARRAPGQSIINISR